MISSGSKVWILAALAITTILLAPMSLQSEEIDSMSLINQVQPLNEIRVGKKLFTTSDIIINASPSQVWEVLTDYDRSSPHTASYAAANRAAGTSQRSRPCGDGISAPRRGWPDAA